MVPAFELVGDEVRLLKPWDGKLASSLPPDTVQRLSLNVRLGWKPTTGLEFLKEFRNLRILSIVCFQKIDLKPLIQLKDLKTLRLELYPKIKQPFDFQQLPDLTSLTIYWNHGFNGIQELKKLEWLIIKEVYQVKHLDLSGLGKLKTLYLVSGSGIHALTLAGICSLESLTLERLPKLDAVSGFCAGATVKTLKLSRVGKIPPSFWKQFSNLDRVECSLKESITEESFSRPPKSFLRWPI